MSEDRDIDGAIKDAIEYDPIHEAEKSIEKLNKAFDPTDNRRVSYKDGSPDGKAATSWGFLNMVQNAEKKDQLAELNNDTTMRSTLTHYLSVVTDLGFKKVLEMDVPMDKRHPDDSKVVDKYYIFVTDDGLVLSMDTYRDCANSPKLYYNRASNYPDLEKRGLGWGSSGMVAWDPQTNQIREPRSFPYEHDDDYETTKDGWREYLNSGQWTLVAGHMDGRDFLRYHVNKLRNTEHGRLVTPWVDRPFLWFLHYMDTKCLKCCNNTSDFQPHNRCTCDPQTHGYDYEEINKERIEMADPILKKIIGG